MKMGIKPKMEKPKMPKIPKPKAEMRGPNMGMPMAKPMMPKEHLQGIAQSRAMKGY